MSQSLAAIAASELHPFVRGETPDALLDCLDGLLEPVYRRLPAGRDGRGWVDGFGEVAWANFPDGSVWNVRVGPGARPISLPDYTPGGFDAGGIWRWEGAGSHPPAER